MRRMLRLAALACAVAPRLLGSDSVESAATPPEFRWYGVWPFYYRDSEKQAWLGPFIETWDTGDEQGAAVRPLFSRFEEEERGSSGVDVAFPLATKRRHDDLARSQVLQVLSRTDAPAGSRQEHRTTLFPVVFNKTSPISEERYTAVFPVAGKMLDRFGQDKIRFFLFPLCMERTRNGVVTSRFLFPIFSRIEGPGVHGAKVFPLGGTVRRGDTTSGFLFWPFVLWRTSPAAQAFAFLPFYSRSVGATYRTVSFLWPFFTRRHQTSPAYHETGAPWPFLVFGTGANRSVTRIWPLVGTERRGDTAKSFFLWPLWRQSLGSERSWRRILFILATDRVQPPDDPKDPVRIATIWPILVWRRNSDDTRTWQIPAPVSGILPRSRGVQRNLAPIFRLIHYQEDESGDHRFDMLWRLFQVETGPRHSEWSIAGSLVQRTRVDTDQGPVSRWRFLFGLFDTGRSAADRRPRERGQEP